MIKYKYEYTICSQPDEEIFRRQCEALEKSIPGLIKGDFLQDVDGSVLQFYQLRGNQIRVSNDMQRC